MAAQVGQITVNVVDNLMVGVLGAAALAAISVSIAIFIIFYVVGMGISYALPPLISHADGSDQHKEIKRYFKHSLIINVSYAVFAILSIEAIIPFLENLGQDPDVVVLAIPYLRLAAWSMLPMMLFQTFRCYADGLSETMPSMIAMLIGNVANVLLNYVLIFGKFGVEARGVEGAALGTLISRILMCVLIVVILYNWKDIWKHLYFINFRRYHKNLFKKVLSLGIPTSLQMFFEVSAFAGCALIMGSISKEAQAAHQIAINLAAITFLTCTGLSMASTIRVGRRLGQGRILMARHAGLSAIIQAVLLMFCTAIVFVLLRDFLPTLYIKDGNVIAIASTLLIMAAIFQIPDGVQVTALGALRGIQDVNIPSAITFFAYWMIGLPISYLTAFYSNLGPIGVWLGLVVGLSVSGSLLTWRFYNKTRSLDSLKRDEDENDLSQIIVG